jgi:hypothetical protein
MAQKKKATTKKVTAKNVTAKAKPKAKRTPPPKPTYDDVYAARLAMNAADEEVKVAGRGLNRAKANFSDFAARAALIDTAGANLRAARAVASEANENFKKVKAAAQ